MLKKWLSELDELLPTRRKIARRVWDNSTEVIDKEGRALNKENIQKSVRNLAQQIIETYTDKPPVIVGLMDGATPFADLLRKELKKLNYKDFTYTTMSVSSYGNQLVSKEVKINSLPKVKLCGRPVLLVDDVCDSGKTIKKVKEVLEAQHPKDIKIMVMVDKKQTRNEGIDPDFRGFEIGADDFIIGMGLDYHGELRNEESIKKANPKAFPNAIEEAMLDRIDTLIELIEAEPRVSVANNIHTLFGESSSAPKGKEPESTFTP